MASLFNMPRLKDRRNEPDNLLGIDGDIGMTDSSFQGMGRAPVNELWAGRYSAAIDDEEFEEKVKLAKAARERALSAKKSSYLDGQPSFNKQNSEIEWLADSREYIYDESGLDIYPGHMRADEKTPIFMEEFSDADSKFRDGSFEALADAAEKGNGLLLGDVFDHPELYRHYPEVQMLPVALNKNMKEGHRGSYFRPTGERPLGLMHLNPSSTPEDSRETMLHELQHFIQTAEGWEGGGSASTQLGLDYAENLLNSAKTHVGDNESPIAQELGQRVVDKYDESTSPLEFMKKEDLGNNLKYDAYFNLTGEQLARDATFRDESGDQVKNYYYGGSDMPEHGNWNRSDATFEHMPVMPEVRQYLMDNGLLGPILGANGKQEKHDAIDPYVEKYMQAMMEGRK